MTFRMTEQEIQDYKRRQSVAKAKNPRGSANNEQHSGNAAEVENEIKKALPPVVVRFTHYRRRPMDSDAAYTKHFVDGYVKAGLLRDDSLKEIKETRHRQVKIENWQEEYMEVEFIESTN